MKLFGLQESVTIEWAYPLRIPVPQYSLFKKLEEYDSSLSVGIELAFRGKKLRIPPITFENQKVFLDLFGWFKSRGNKIILLEPKESLLKVAELSKKIPELEKELEKDGLDEKTKRSLRIDLDKSAIESNYMSWIGKENYILQNIIKHRPALVFLGDGHAATFYKNGDLKKHGIKIEEYWNERYIKRITEENVWRAASLSDRHLTMEHILEDDMEIELKKIESPEQIPNNLYPERTWIERLYKAVKEGRITDGKCDYIGTWDLDLEHRGLFEVYIEYNFGNVIKGKIFDCLGDAVFSGIVDGDRITFVKEYTEVYGNAAKRAISYEGALQGEEYVGSLEYNGPQAGFKMKKFQ